MSIITTVASAGRTAFDVTFPYILQEHVHVYRDGVETTFEWSSSTEIILSEPATEGERITRQRITPGEPLVDFSSGAGLTENDLDLVARQGLYVAVETRAAQTTTITEAAGSLTFDAFGRTISNVGDPVSIGDAVNMAWVEAAIAAVGTNTNQGGADLSVSISVGGSSTPSATYDAVSGVLNIILPASVDVAAVDAASVDAAGAIMNTDTSTAPMGFVVDEDDMVSDSPSKVPTQQSVKAYVDANGGGLPLTGGTLTGPLVLEDALRELEYGAFFVDAGGNIVHALSGRVFGGTSANHNGKTRANALGGTPWVQTGDEGDNLAGFPAGSRLQWAETQAQCVFTAHDGGGIGVSGLSRTSSNNSAVGVSGIARQETGVIGRNSWGGYFEGIKGANVGDNGGTWGAEIAIMNFDAEPSPLGITPHIRGYQGFTKGLMLNVGGGNSNAHNADVFLQFRGDYVDGGVTKGARAYAGFVMDDTALIQTVSGVGSPATAKAAMFSSTSNHALTWGNVTGVLTELYSSAAGTMVLNRIGGTDPYFLDFRADGTSKGSLQSVADGLSLNSAGALTIKSNQPTGRVNVGSVMNLAPFTAPATVEGDFYYNGTDYIINYGAGPVALGSGGGSGDDTQTYLEATRIHDIGKDVAGVSAINLKLYANGDPLVEDAYIARWGGVNSQVEFHNTGNAGFNFSCAGGATLAVNGTDRVNHSGISAGGLGGFAFAEQRTGATITFGAIVNGSDLWPTDDRGIYFAASALTGTWRCLGHAEDDHATLFQRVT